MTANKLSTTSPPSIALQYPPAPPPMNRARPHSLSLPHRPSPLPPALKFALPPLIIIFPPLRVRLRVRIIFLRPPLNSCRWNGCMSPTWGGVGCHKFIPPLLVRRCILAPLRFEHRFTIFVIYIIKTKKFKLSYKNHKHFNLTLT